MGRWSVVRIVNLGGDDKDQVTDVSNHRVKWCAEKRCKALTEQHKDNPTVRYDVRYRSQF